MITPHRHIKYLCYIITHKWFVFIAKMKLSLFHGTWLAIIHDHSKFYPSEWFPYAKTFYDNYGNKQYKETDDFNLAWNHHQKRNKHHYQYWVLLCDEGRTVAIEMPTKYVYEMVADWAGAGRAITGKWEVKEWYLKNKAKIILHDITRKNVETLLEILCK